MKIKVVATLTAIAIAGVWSSAVPAQAQYDPRIPIDALNWCPGGGTFTGMGGFCQGTPYADGTMWISTYGCGIPFVGCVDTPMTCVINTGQPMPPLAPPKGCGR